MGAGRKSVGAGAFIFADPNLYLGLDLMFFHGTP
jgi:hypothetical protein